MAASKDEVPIGAVLVSTDQNVTHSSSLVLSTSHNLVETLVDASAHAELLALRSAAQRIKNWRLHNTTLYSTLEPCPMCLSACQAFRVNSIVYGARDIRLGAVESYIRLLDKRVYPAHPFHPNITIVSGIRAGECSFLIQDFFRKKRTAQKNQHFKGGNIETSPFCTKHHKGVLRNWRRNIVGWLKGSFEES
jgi:tRNA(adenine34) deaminase